MSLSDDGGYGGDHRGSETGQTRTRLPDGDNDAYGTGRRPRAGGLSSRNLVTIVGVVVLLIAAIAFANRGGSGNSETASDDTAQDAAAQPTAPTGTKPVNGKNGGIAAGFAKTEQGAQSAAANYAVALASDDMFKPRTRHADRQHGLCAPRQVDDMQERASTRRTPTGTSSRSSGSTRTATPRRA